VVLRQQDCVRQADIADTVNRDFHMLGAFGLFA
jgi:hypothetical protein